jgi:Amt family ammonium transporter
MNGGDRRSAFIVLNMQTGFTLVETGCGQRKNAFNTAVMNIVNIASVATAWWATGFGISFGTSAGGVLGTTHFFDGMIHPLWMFMFSFASTAATIPSGSVAGMFH